MAPKELRIALTHTSDSIGVVNKAIEVDAVPVRVAHAAGAAEDACLNAFRQARRFAEQVPKLSTLGSLQT
jgi:hypothetical protein